MRADLFWLSDDQWRQIEPHLRTDVRGKDRVDDRRVISGILPAAERPAAPLAGAAQRDAIRLMAPRRLLQLPISRAGGGAAVERREDVGA